MNQKDFQSSLSKSVGDGEDFPGISSKRRSPTPEIKITYTPPKFVPFENATNFGAVKENFVTEFTWKHPTTGQPHFTRVNLLEMWLTQLELMSENSSLKRRIDTLEKK